MNIKKWIVITLTTGILGVFVPDVIAYFSGVAVVVLWGIYYELEVLVKEVKELRKIAYFSNKEKEE